MMNARNVRGTVLAAAASMVTAFAFAFPERLLTPEDTARDLSVLRQALIETHPGLTRHQSRETLDRAFESLQTRARQPMDSVAFYREIALLLASIRCDHTKAEVPAALSAWREKNTSHLPFRFRLFGDRMFVQSSGARQAALPRGTEILSLNGQPVAGILAKLRPAMSIDGRTEASRTAKLEADSDLMGSGFDHFYPVHFGFPREWVLETMVPGDAVPRSITMKPLTYADWQSLPWTSEVKAGEFYKSVTWRLSGKNAMLRVDTFVNYRNPVDAMRFYAAFFAQLKENKTEHLIIDLRNNGGGSDDAATALASHLLEGEFTYTKPSLQRAIRFGDWQQHVQTWGDRKALFEPPESDFRKPPESGFFERAEPARKYLAAPDRFGGKVTVLTGPRNASGATMLIAKLKDAKRVTLVGEATGGSAEGPTAGRMFFVKLPASGIVARIPVQWNRLEISTFAPGLGVAPDVEVSPTLAEWLAGKDPALEVALGRPR
ncbi:MAG: hypothetical protein JNJ55_02730 [Betaproteobacteria bacterium]|nr:hypothetical protein [Betaproteobacteria bacterium]